MKKIILIVDLFMVCLVCYFPRPNNLPSWPSNYTKDRLNYQLNGVNLVYVICEMAEGSGCKCRAVNVYTKIDGTQSTYTSGTLWQHLGSRKRRRRN